MKFYSSLALCTLVAVVSVGATARVMRHSVPPTVITKPASQFIIMQRGAVITAGIKVDDDSILHVENGDIHANQCGWAKLLVQLVQANNKQVAVLQEFNVHVACDPPITTRRLGPIS